MSFTNDYKGHRILSGVLLISSRNQGHDLFVSAPIFTVKNLEERPSRPLAKRHIIFLSRPPLRRLGAASLWVFSRRNRSRTAERFSNSLFHPVLASYFRDLHFLDVFFFLFGYHSQFLQFHFRQFQKFHGSFFEIFRRVFLRVV